jgi:cytochrome c oxidase assembly factor CtaG
VDCDLDRRGVHRLIALLAAALPALAHAFHDVTAAGGEGWRWNFEPALVALLVTSAALYAKGLLALWRSAGVGRGIGAAQAARFAIGWLALVAALVSPLDVAAAGSFAVHMIQHELLMVVAAPLLVLGRPLEAWAWALPPGLLRFLARLAGARGVKRAWHRVTSPLGAWSLHALALWTWHLPLFFAAALASQPLHVLQHASFFASALAFWSAVFGRGAGAPDATSIASLFTTMLHTSLLGALLTFAPTAWYSAGGGTLGLDPLEDQQLGGLVMWLPGGLGYLVAGLAIAGRWLREPPPPPLRTAGSRASLSPPSC